MGGGAPTSTFTPYHSTPEDGAQLRYLPIHEVGKLLDSIRQVEPGEAGPQPAQPAGQPAQHYQVLHHNNRSTSHQ